MHFNRLIIEMNFQVLIFVLLATCLLLADAKSKKNKKNEHEKNNKARAGARDSKVLITNNKLDKS